jgi:hypothetical protein
MPQNQTSRTIELSWGEGKNKTILPITIQPKDYAKYFQNPQDENSPLLYDAILSNLESVRPDLYKKWSEFNPAAHSARIEKRNKDINEYQRTWLSGDRPESIPFQRYREYATSPNQSKFDFQGLSDIGQRAIKAKYDTEQRASFASEQAAGNRANIGTAASALAGSMMAGGTPYGALIPSQSRDYILNYLLPAANRRLTAIRTGQDVSKALPLGLDPASQISPPNTFGGRMRQNLGSLGRAEAVALAPAAIAAAPVLEAYPLLAMLGGAASMIPAGVELAKGNYGAAGAEALTALPINAVTRPVSSTRKALKAAEEAADRAAQTRAVAKALGYTPRQFKQNLKKASSEQMRVEQAQKKSIRSMVQTGEIPESAYDKFNEDELAYLRDVLDVNIEPSDVELEIARRAVSGKPTDEQVNQSILNIIPKELPETQRIPSAPNFVAPEQTKLPESFMSEFPVYAFKKGAMGEYSPILTEAQQDLILNHMVNQTPENRRQLANLLDLLDLRSQKLEAAGDTQPPRIEHNPFRVKTHAEELKKLADLLRLGNDIPRTSSSDTTQTIQKLKTIMAENLQRASVLETRGNYDLAAQLRKQARDIEVRLARLHIK